LISSNNWLDGTFDSWGDYESVRSKGMEEHCKIFIIETNNTAFCITGDSNTAVKIVCKKGNDSCCDS
jgi:hypothetical protein